MLQLILDQQSHHAASKERSIHMQSSGSRNKRAFDSLPSLARYFLWAPAGFKKLPALRDYGSPGRAV
ncbi:hypothetical protein ACSS6W_009685 [Trichoderma asperelloides]